MSDTTFRARTTWTAAAKRTFREVTEAHPALEKSTLSALYGACAPLATTHKGPAMPTATAPATAATTAAHIRAMGESCIRLADALSQAQHVQHDRPAAPSQRQDDPSRQTTGAVSNPTADIATDTRRLRLRAAVISGELAADSIAARADQAADELAAALECWAGTRW